MTDKNMTVKTETASPVRNEATRAGERYLTPAVDIFETENGLTLVADLPGVAKENLEIGIDKGVLTLEGRTGKPQGNGNVYHEFSIPGYYRRFQLPDGLDSEHSSAELKDGVLTLKLPKAAAARPRRIEVTSVH
ncbi:heat-shock protein Hsp20 [Desulfuromonas versatilis]|uniref:Heat-shock protein Hsp20 n=1 Tax=Desulfuromonas versatilis TaxID=2802975 RepID=A0ABN6E332_9BACT|nr:Hsp20/alpha crystallin family protein [Desulfuromonas versatilis]BCR06736.1 heat-shock protein Hsp20 [Desulfuromonas versatilis]